MQIQVNTDSSIPGSESLETTVRQVVESALSRFSDRITRVEVHLSDENGDKGGRDKRCMMEARLEGRRPAAVTHHAATVPDAVTGAAGQLTRLIESTLGRLESREPRG